MAVSADGVTIVAGAPNGAATAGTKQGAVYVFVRPGAAWGAAAMQVAKLTASDGATGDQLGYAVAVSADGATVVAGALNADTNGAAAAGTQQGAVYVFVRPGAAWGATASQTAKLTASDGANGDQLGRSVAVSADGATVVAGAPDADTNGASAGEEQGAAYVFVRPGAAWGAAVSQAVRLTASDGVNGDVLGVPVAVSADGTTVVAGAPHAGIDGATSTRQGAVYLFATPSPAVAGAPQATGVSPVLAGSPTLVSVTNPQTGTSYQWDFGDGSASAPGTAVSHAYTTTGTFTATVTAQNGSLVQTAKVAIQVVASLPQVALAAPQALGSTPTLVGSPTLVGVTNPQFGTAYQWDSGDSSAVASGPLVSHVYPDIGTYQATVTAQNGGQTQTASVTIVVVRPGATAFLPLGVISAGGW